LPDTIISIYRLGEFYSIAESTMLAMMPPTDRKAVKGVLNEGTGTGELSLTLKSFKRTFHRQDLLEMHMLQIWHHCWT
jgi:hypothetical protein